MPKDLPYRLIILKEIPERHTLTTLYYKTMLDLKIAYDIFKQGCIPTRNYKFITEEYMDLETEWVDVENLIK